MSLRLMWRKACVIDKNASIQQFISQRLKLDIRKADSPVSVIGSIHVMGTLILKESNETVKSGAPTI